MALAERDGMAPLYDRAPAAHFTSPVAPCFGSKFILFVSVVMTEDGMFQWIVDIMPLSIVKETGESSQNHLPVKAEFLPAKAGNREIIPRSRVGRDRQG